LGLQADEARTLTDFIDVTSLPCLQDRTLIALMVYTFTRLSASVSMRFEDFHAQDGAAGYGSMKKSGKEYQMPTHQP
jgi:integrase